MAAILHCKMVATRGANMLGIFFFQLPLGGSTPLQSFMLASRKWTILVDMWYLPLYYRAKMFDKLLCQLFLCYNSNTNYRQKWSASWFYSRLTI